MEKTMSENIIENKLLYNLEHIVDKKPLTADIFLTNYCNNRCPYCAYARYEGRREKGAYMRYDDFVIYAKRLLELGVKGFILTGGGEPTINPDFDRITAWLEEHDIAYGINTNFNKLKLIKPKYLKVSFDAWSDESYKEKRGVEKYEVVRENIKQYRAWQELEGHRTALGIQVLVQSMDDINLFYEANKDLDVDYIVFRPVESKQGIYYQEHSADKFIKRLEELAEDDPRITINYKWYKLDAHVKECYAQANQIALTQKGEVVYCCHKPYDVVGHILDYDIMEKKRNHQTDMSMCDVPCRLTGANLFVQKLQEGCKDSEFI
jgi:MoaA/NifB/PqqE/SkfB family radical SAM enzyme